MTYIESPAVAGIDRRSTPARFAASLPESACRGLVAWTGLGDMLGTEVESDAQARLARTSGARTQMAQFFGHLLLEGEGIVSGEIDPAYIAKVRESLPALKHRKM